MVKIYVSRIFLVFGDIIEVLGRFGFRGVFYRVGREFWDFFVFVGSFVVCGFGFLCLLIICYDCSLLERGFWMRFLFLV